MADQQEASDGVLSVSRATDQVFGARSMDVVEATYKKEQKHSDPVEEIGSTPNNEKRRETSEEPILTHISETLGEFEDSTFNIQELRGQLNAKDAQIKDLEKKIEERDITIARQNVELGRKPLSESEGLRERKPQEDKEELTATIYKLEGEVGSLIDRKIVLENELKNVKRYGLVGLVIILVSSLVILFMFLSSETGPVCPDISIYKEKIDQLSAEIVQLGTKTALLKSNSDKVTADLNTCKVKTGEINEKAKKLEADKADLEGELSTEKQLKTVLEGEMNRLETEKKSLQDGLTKLDTKLTQVEAVLEEEKNELQTKKKHLEDDVTKLDAKLKILNQESHQKIDKLQIDLSECRTINDKNRVTESDLEPIKLGEQFRTIYEQHYTMAVDELEDQHGSQDVRETVQKFLNILKAAHTMTEEYTKRHVESMNTSITSVQIDKHEASTEGEKNPVFVNSTLSMFDLKNFYEIRQKCAWRMLDSVAKELGDVIARQFSVNPDSQPKMMTYIRSCVSLCWKTNMHREPVYIDFSEPGTREEFDYDTFKPFLYPTGDYMDYVVWPPMYVHKGGQMIAKGIAERKN